MKGAVWLRGRRHLLSVWRRARGQLRTLMRRVSHKGSPRTLGCELYHKPVQGSARDTFAPLELIASCGLLLTLPPSRHMCPAPLTRPRASSLPSPSYMPCHEAAQPAHAISTPAMQARREVLAALVGFLKCGHHRPASMGPLILRKAIAPTGDVALHAKSHVSSVAARL